MFRLVLVHLKGLCAGYVDVDSMLEYPTLEEAIKVAEDINHVFFCDICVTKGEKVVARCFTEYLPEYIS